MLIDRYRQIDTTLSIRLHYALCATNKFVPTKWLNRISYLKWAFIFVSWVLHICWSRFSPLQTDADRVPDGGTRCLYARQGPWGLGGQQQQVQWNSAQTFLGGQNRGNTCNSPLKVPQAKKSQLLSCRSFVTLGEVVKEMSGIFSCA